MGNVTGRNNYYQYHKTVNNVTTTNLETTITTEAIEVNPSKLLDGIVDSYNSKADDKLEYKVSFTPSDKNSSHYRTEFRLGSFSNAIGKTYSMNEKTVDLVITNPTYGDHEIRVYADDMTFEGCRALIAGFSPILDPDLSSSELNGILKYIDEDKSANGKYYGDLCLLLLNHHEGYELMIRTT